MVRNDHTHCQLAEPEKFAARHVSCSSARLMRALVLRALAIYFGPAEATYGWASERFELELYGDWRHALRRLRCSWPTLKTSEYLGAIDQWTVRNCRSRQNTAGR
jgi:hypothetical protein